MHFRNGTVRQKALFATLVGVYVLGLCIAFADKVARVGQPDVGFVMDGRDLFPTRADAGDAGLYGGGRALRINGLPLQGRFWWREILISARVRGELLDGYRTEPAGELTLKGFHQPQAAYRLLETETRQRAMG